MGRGATATLERLAASLGLLNEATPRFAAAERVNDFDPAFGLI